MTWEPITISHEGYLEIMITALGLMITLLAVVLAIFGFIGYRSLKQSAAEAAEKTAQDTARDVAAEVFSGELEREVSSAAKKAVAAALKTRRSIEQGRSLSKEQFLEKGEQDKQLRTGITSAPRRAKKDSDLKGGPR